MKHRNDLKLNIDKEAKKGTVLKRILITGILVLLIQEMELQNQKMKKVIIK